MCFRQWWKTREEKLWRQGPAGSQGPEEVFQRSMDLSEFCSPPCALRLAFAWIGSQRPFEQRYRFGGKAKGKGKGKRTAWDPYFSEAPAKRGRSDGNNSSLQKEIAALKAAFDSRCAAVTCTDRVAQCGLRLCAQVISRCRSGIHSTRTCICSLLAFMFRRTSACAIVWCRFAYAAVPRDHERDACDSLTVVEKTAGLVIGARCTSCECR